MNKIRYKRFLKLYKPLLQQRNLKFITTIFIFFIVTGVLYAQKPILFLKEGRLWETVNLSKIGPTFANWSRSGYGMDYPGYDTEWIPGHIGAPPSHHVGGGFWIGALNDSGIVRGREDYALYAGSVGFESTSKYIATKHEFLYDDKDNYFLQQNPNSGEVVIETEYQWNPNYLFPYTRKAYLPIKVNRKIHQWVTHDIDQDYIIIDYTVTNVGDSTMYKTYILFMYGFAVNARGWSILFPNYNQGARNTRVLWDQNRRMMYAYASDFKESSGNDSYDYWEAGGPDRQGEYLAPAYVGLKFLYISPDSSGTENRINGYGWSASHPTQGSHPFTDKGIMELDYAVIKNPAMATDAITSPGDSRWGSTKVWTLVSLGPWDLALGDSIHIVTAELVGSVTYDVAVDPNAASTDIAKGKQLLFDLSERAQQNFENHYNIPDPPAGPLSFELDYLGEDRIGTVISWSAVSEYIPDPDYFGEEAYDLAGYRIYRSDYLPIGPWQKIADVVKGDDLFFDRFTNTYTLIDTNLVNGAGYYYAITAYDNGHATWPVNPSAFPSGVPSLESSKYINRTTRPFQAGYGPAKTLKNILVSPNPFVVSKGAGWNLNINQITFVNIPSPCTIRIYTIRGDLVKTINHDGGSGNVSWDMVSEWGQFVESGIYLYQVTSQSVETKGQTEIGKFSIIK